MVRLRNSSWVWDGRIRGQRKILAFKDKATADNFERDIAAAKQLGINQDDILKKYGKLQRESELRKEVTLSVPEAIREYCNSIFSQRKPTTVDWDKRVFETLYDYLHGLGINDLKDIKYRHMYGFQNMLSVDSRYKGSTVNRYFQTIKPFFREMIRREYIDKSPCEALKSLRSSPKKKILWTDEYFSKVVAEMGTWALPPMKFIRGTGCRPDQAFQLTYGCLDLVEGTATLHSIKGGVTKKVKIPLAPSLIAELKRHKNLAQIRLKAKPDDLVFVGPDGSSKIQPDYFYTLIRRICIRLQLPPLNPYGLRHSFGTELVRKKTPLRAIANLMGHTDTRTTEGYIGEISDLEREAIAEN